MKWAGKFIKDIQGGFAIWFAVGAMILAITGGAAIDINHAHRAERYLQDLTDTAALTAARDPSLKTKEKKKIVKVFINDAFEQNYDLHILTIKLKTKKNGTVEVATVAEINTMMMGVLGKKTLKVKAISQAMSGGIGKTEIIFALDYSSSMNGQYEAMRDAVVMLINTITSGGTNADVKIGLVPYAEHIYLTIPGKYAVSGFLGTPWSNCTLDRAWPWTVTDNTPTGNFNSKFGLLSESGVPDKDDYEDECDPYIDHKLTVRSLSTNHSGTIAQVKAMTPHSGTNVSLAAQIAFQVISPNAPYIEASQFGSKWKKVIILMSDGSHNRKGHGPENEWTEEQGIANIARTCTNAKNEGILMITVAYELDDDEGKEDLKNCASSLQHYVEGQEENIMETFQNIGDMLLTGTRLVK